MREDYDVIEDVNFKRHTSLVHNKFLLKISIALGFIILCAGCFNLVYLLSFKSIQKTQDYSQTGNNSSTKIFLIEEKLQKDLNKIRKNN